MIAVANRTHSNQLIKSYIGGLSSGKAVDYVLEKAYASRVERRSFIRSRNYQVLERNLKEFKLITENFLVASKRYLEVVVYESYLNLEETEELAEAALSSIDLRIKALQRIKQHYDIKHVDEIAIIMNDLYNVNQEILVTTKKSIAAHSLDNAIKFGYVLISDINSEDYSLVLNFRIEVTELDNEVKGEIEDLDIIVYDDNVKNLIDSIKEYIIDLYEELVDSDDLCLVSDLLHQKEILKNFVVKNN